MVIFYRNSWCTLLQNADFPSFFVCLPEGNGSNGRMSISQGVNPSPNWVLTYPTNQSSDKQTGNLDYPPVLILKRCNWISKNGGLNGKIACVGFPLPCLIAIAWGYQNLPIFRGTDFSTNKNGINVPPTNFSTDFSTNLPISNDPCWLREFCPHWMCNASGIPPIGGGNPTHFCVSQPLSGLNNCLNGLPNLVMSNK